MVPFADLGGQSSVLRGRTVTNLSLALVRLALTLIGLATGKVASIAGGLLDSEKDAAVSCLYQPQASLRGGLAEIADHPS